MWRGPLDLDRNVELIFTKLSRLMCIRGRVYPIIFGENWHDRTTDTRKLVPQKLVFSRQL